MKQKAFTQHHFTTLGSEKSGAGFTLIEILVVLAIIGLIISVIFINLKGAREKAKLARTFQFYQSVNHALGAYIVGAWSFNTIDGSTVLDLSGYGNNGTIQGNPQRVDGLSALGKALSFDGNDYVNIPDNYRLDNTNKLTIEFWVYPTFLDGQARGVISKRVNVNNQQSYSIFFFTNNRLYFDINGNTNRFSTNASFGKNTWYYVVLIYDGTLSSSQRVKVFIDSSLDKISSEGSASIPDYVSDLTIGILDAGDSRAFVGMIDEVKIYNEALAVAEIQKHYAEGMEGHKNLALGE